MTSELYDDELFEKVRAIIADQLDAPLERVKPDARFIEDLAADSLDSVDIAMTIEEEFALEITNEDAEGFHTVGDLVEYLRQRGR